MRGGYFYLGACSQGKIATTHLVRTVSPTHTEGSVFMVFVFLFVFVYFVTLDVIERYVKSAEGCE